MNKPIIKLLCQQSLLSFGLGMITIVNSYAEPMIMQPVDQVNFQELPPPWTAAGMSIQPISSSSYRPPRQISIPTRRAPKQITIPRVTRARTPVVQTVRPAKVVVRAPAPAPKNTMQSLTTKAKQGNAKAQLELGKRYQYGRGVPKSRTRAHRWLYKASASGLAEGHYALSMFYQSHVKTEQGIRKSLLLLKKSANSGYANAQYTLGMMFQNGTLVNVDTTEARKWLQLAAQQGHTAASLAL
ncbi:MAG: sel1 repeat family protein [Thiotrichaceae bacterium]|nr:sel1 repeat family protein [Thiotrichaceae bacterium]